MGIFDHYPPAYFTANCDQRLKDAWLDEGGKLAQPQSFALRPKEISYSDIKLETPDAAKVNPSSWSTSLLNPSIISAQRREHHQNNLTSRDPYSTTRSVVQANETGKYRAYHEIREASSRLQNVQQGMSIGARDHDPKGGRTRYREGDAMVSAIKKEKEDVDRSLDGSLDDGGDVTESKDREISGMRDVQGLPQDGQTRLQNQRLGAQDGYTEYHTARTPSRSTPRLPPGTCPFVPTCHHPCSAHTTTRRPPSSFSEVKQEWTVDLLVFCSETDQGLGRKDDEVLGFPTTKGSTLFIFSEEWIKEKTKLSTSSKMKDRYGRSEPDFKDHFSQVPRAYQDHHSLMIGKRYTPTSAPRSSFPEPAWVAGEPSNPLIDNYPFTSVPLAVEGRGEAYSNQTRSRKQQLPISPMRTPSFKVPPEFEWNSDYDSWQREAGRRRDLERSGRVYDEFRSELRLGKSEQDNQGRAEVRVKRPAGQPSGSAYMVRHGISTTSKNGEIKTGLRTTLAEPLSKPSRQIVRQLFGDTLGQHDTQNQHLVGRKRQVEMHRDPNAKSAVRKVKYMIQVQDGNGLRRIEVSIPDSMKKALGIDESKRESHSSRL